MPDEMESKSAYDKAWVRLDDLIEEGDAEGVRDLAENIRIRNLWRSEMPEDIEVNGQPQGKRTYYWNGLLKAIYEGQTEIVEFFMEEARINIRSCIMLSESLEENTGQSDDKFALELALATDNVELITYLWTQHMYLWNPLHLKYMTEKLFAT